MKTLLLSLILCFLAHAQSGGINQVLGPIDENLIVAHYQSLKIYNKDLSLIKEIVKMDPILEIATGPRITIEKNLILMTAVNKVYVLDKNGNELSSAQVKLGRIESPAVKLKDGRFASVSVYSLFGGSSVYINFFKLTGSKIKADGHIRIKNMVSTTTHLKDVILESGDFFYFVNGRGELIQVSKRGKVKNLTEAMGYINSSIAQTKDGKIVFTIMEKPGKIFYYFQGEILSTDLSFSVNQFELDIKILALADKIFIQASGSLALLDSNLNLIKSVDLSPIIDRSMIIQAKIINPSLISLVVFSFNQGRTTEGQVQGILLYDFDLNLQHNLLKSDGSFTPIDAGTISSEGILYAGDHKGVVQSFKLN